METTIIKNEVAKYLEGNDLGDVMHMVSQVFVEHTIFAGKNANKENNIVRLNNPAPFKTWWEFYSNDELICIVKYESLSEDGHSNTVWLEWIRDYNGMSFLDYYVENYGYSDEIDWDDNEEVAEYLRYQ
jgi:hypothetical protein